MAGKEEYDVRSYWVTLRQREDCTWKTNRQIQLSAELALEDDFDRCNVMMISEVILRS